MATVTWSQPSFAGGELAPSMAARIDHEKYHVGCRTLRNMFVHSHGGVSNRPGTKHIATALGAGSVLIPFQFSSTDTYVLELGNQTMRVLRNGALVESSPGVPYTVATPYTSAQAASLKFTQSADTMFFVHPDVRPYTLVRVSDTNWTWTAITFAPSHSAPSGLTASPAFGSSSNWSYRVSALVLNGSDYEKGTASNVLLVSVPSTFSGQVFLVWTDMTVDAYLVERNKGAGWSAIAIVTSTNVVDDDLPTISDTTVPGASGPPVLLGALWGDPDARTYKYRITLEVDGEESVASTTEALGLLEYPWPQAARIALSWTAPTIPVGSTSSYIVNIYKSDRGQYGWIGAVDAKAGISNFYDDNITPDVTRVFPTVLLNDFTATNGKPGAVGIFEQRLWLARTNSNPQTVWGSALGVLRNFYSRTQALPSDAVEATLATSQLNDVRHIVPLDRLVLLTGTAEWVLDSGNNADAISPTALRARVQSYRGASDVRPLVIGNNALFIQRNGSAVRDLGYKFESDSYAGNDLTVLANHLLREDNVKCWCYQQAPNGLVWAITTGGQLLSFTYLPEHAIWAWARHETDGTVLWITSIPSTDEDEVYLVVQRSTGTFLERMAARSTTSLAEAFFVDCGKSYTSPGTTVTGLSHLEGKTVAVLADGDHLVKVVASGQITLPRAYTRVHVGLPFSSDLETMNLELKTKDGTVQGKRKCVKEITVRVESSRAFSAGPSFDQLTEAKWRNTEAYDEATNLLSGDRKLTLAPVWGTDGRVCIRNTAPTPLTVLAVFAEVDVGT